MLRRTFRNTFLALALARVLAGCGDLATRAPSPEIASTRPNSPQAREVVMYALTLIDTGYRFGGKNPEAGLDCSGMVAYVFERAAGRRVAGSAADIARQGRPVARDELAPGDLVFFNTLNRPLSHVGIYIGDGRFVHAPSSASGRVRIDALDKGYFASRFETARTYFD